MVKNLFFIFMGFISISSCCCGDSYDGGGYSSSHYYYRRIVLSDTTNGILEIAFKNTNKKITPNDTTAELIVSENKETTMYIKTKTSLDTITLFTKVEYSYDESNCEKDRITKAVYKTPIIVSHTFSNANIRSISINRSKYYAGDTDNYDDLVITP